MKPNEALPKRGPLRAILIAVLLLPPNALWLVQTEMLNRASNTPGSSGGPYPSTFSLFANVICIIAALLLVNVLIKRIKASAVLNPSELLIIYCMLSIGTAMTSVDGFHILVPMIGHLQRYANNVNQWAHTVIPLVPKFMLVSDPTALTGWYTGSGNPFAVKNMLAWWKPMVWWGSFSFILLWVMLCLNVLIRKQWTQNERLSYPTIMLPLEMTENTSNFFRNKLMWAGFLVAAGISFVNGVSYFMPNVPTVPIKALNLGQYITSAPWNAMGINGFMASFYPFAIGLSFLLPADLLFSCWFFYLINKMELVISSQMGYLGINPQFPYIAHQSLGGYLAVGVLAIMGARMHLKSVFVAAWRGENEPDSGWLGYRIASIGALVGLIMLCLYFNYMGLPFIYCVVAFLLYFLIGIAITRMRAELGPPAHDLHYAGPDTLFISTLGAGHFTTKQLTALSWFYWFNRAYRSLAMPHQLEAMKIAERRKMGQSPILTALVVAAIVGIASGLFAEYWYGYTKSAEVGMAAYYTGFGKEAFDFRLQNWITASPKAEVGSTIAVGVGFFITLLLGSVRLVAPWWPLHPLGFAISGGYSVGMIWLPMMIAWTCKVTILKFGGLKLYKQAVYFFLGLVLGDYIMGMAWPLFGWITKMATYSFQQ
ncbi:MAG: DUF6785 family protein [Armatimonadota bacterium]